MTDITFSDISQWQPSFDAPAYLAAGHTVIICRALSKDDGPDAMMPERRDYVRGFDFDAVGYYNRLNATVNPAQQAREFIGVIGELAPNEFPVLDLEDGTGDQTMRAEAWFDVVDAWCGFEAALYSGAYFMRDNLGGPGRWGGRPLWIADYTNSGQPDAGEEPAGCDWWQFSCTHHFPGLPGEVDANLYHGTGREFLADVRPGASMQKSADSAGGGPIVLNHDGRIEVFTIDDAGEVEHRWQGKPGQAFNETGWSSLGRPTQGAA
jgi:lysozyme